MNKNNRLPTFEELMESIRTPEALEEAKRRADEEIKRMERGGEEE